MKSCDVEKWAVSRLPIVLRRPKMMAFLKVLVGQVGRLMTQGSRYADDVRYRLSHTSQVCSLRALLNDKLDADERRVDIVDAPIGSEFLIVHERAYERAVLVGTGVYRLAPPRGYVSARELNFVVRVPRDWRGGVKEDRLKALVNRGKLASMRYRVEFTQ